MILSGRPITEFEARMLADEDVLDQVIQSARLSDEVFGVWKRGEVVCLWGYQSLPISNSATIWMWAGPGAKKYKIAFLKESIRTVDALLNQFHEIRSVGEPKSREWLKWLGFEDRLEQELYVTREMFEKCHS